MLAMTEDGRMSSAGAVGCKSEAKLMGVFRQLNDKGKAAAIERIIELSEVSRYKKTD